MKSFVRNGNRPEGSVAEGNIVLECLTFCSRYMQDAETKIRRGSNILTNIAYEDSSGHLGVFCTIGRPLGGAQTKYLINTQ